jgi:hypothetical protein
MDIKIQFDQFDMLPGPAGKRFQRNLLLHGGKTDSQGYSISDCFLHMDAYGQPIIVPAPLGTVLILFWRQAPRSAQQESVLWLEGKLARLA